LSYYFFLKGIGDGFGHPGYPLATPPLRVRDSPCIAESAGAALPPQLSRMLCGLQ